MRKGTQPVRVTIGGAWGQPLDTMASAGSAVKRVIEPDPEALNSKVTPHLDVQYQLPRVCFFWRERERRERTKAHMEREKKKTRKSEPHSFLPVRL